MADQQQIIVRNPEDQEPIYDAEMGNGGPLVVQPGNGDRPNIYVNAPQFHWHQAPRGAADEQARAGLQQIAIECFQFGQGLEQRLGRMDAAHAQVAGVPDAVGMLRARLDILDAARQRGELQGPDFSGVIAELQQKCSQLEKGRQGDAAAKMQEDLQSSAN